MPYGTAFYMYAILSTCTQNVFKLVLQATTNWCPVEQPSLCICFSTLNSRRPLKTDDPCMSPALEYDYWFCFVALLSSGFRGFKRHRSYIIIIIIIIIYYTILSPQKLIKRVLQATTNWCSVEQLSICMPFCLYRMYLNWCYRQLPIDALWNSLLYVCCKQTGQQRLKAIQLLLKVMHNQFRYSTWNVGHLVYGTWIIVTFESLFWLLFALESDLNSWFLLYHSWI